MGWSKPLALLAFVGIVVGSLGAVLTLASATLGLSGVASVSVPAALVTVVFLIVVLFVAVLLGLGTVEESDPSTAYW